MLEFITEMLSAWDQAVWLIGGLIALAIGSSIFATILRFRSGAIETTARIVGVFNARGEERPMYHPVVEFTTLDGKTVTARGHVGSNSLANKVIGAEVRVYYRPGDMEEVWVKSPVGLVIAGVLSGIGILMGLRFFTATGGLWIAAGLATAYVIAGLVYFALRGRRTGADTTAAIEAVAPSPDRAAQGMLDEADIRRRSQAVAGFNRKFAPLAVVAGLALIGGGFYVGVGTANLVNHGLRAQGRLIDFVEGASSRTAVNPMSYLYYPVIEFTTQGGFKVTFQDRLGTNRPQNSLAGRPVPVLYPSDRPQAAIIDRGVWNWTVPSILIFIGLLLAVVGFRTSRASIRR